MITRKKKQMFRVLALLLIIIFIIPNNVQAFETNELTPRASYYLDSYNTYIYPAALGKIQVWFSVTGVNYMDEIGVLSIKIYESSDNENWTWVDTFNHNTTAGMLEYDEVYYTGHVEYRGTIGRYYKAYVCIWAGKDGDGDTRYMWTQPKRATLFAS